MEIQCKNKRHFIVVYPLGTYFCLSIFRILAKLKVQFIEGKTNKCSPQLSTLLHVSTLFLAKMLNKDLGFIEGNMVVTVIIRFSAWGA